MWNQLGAFRRLFQKGQAVANPEAWKKGQIGVTVLAPFLLAITESARALGYDIPLTTEQAVAIAGGVIAVVNVVLTVTTTDKIGIGGAPSTEPDYRGARIAVESVAGTDRSGSIDGPLVRPRHQAQPVPDQDQGGSGQRSTFPGDGRDINGG